MTDKKIQAIFNGIKSISINGEKRILDLDSLIINNKGRHTNEKSCNICKGINKLSNR